MNSLARSLVVLLVAGLSGCGPGALIEGATGGGTGATGGGGGSSAGGPTWSQDLAPLVSRSCSACHVEGGIAPFPLTTFAEAAPMAAALANAVQTKRMPPWMPGGATPPVLHNRSLSDAEIALFVAWAAAGAPEGDTAHSATLIPPEVIPFSDPDVSVTTGADYRPNTSLTDDYRCFVVPLNTTASRMAVAFQITPGNRATVHHVITTLFDGADLAGLQAIDAADPGDGWQCFGGAVPSNSAIKTIANIGGWVPGVSAVEYAKGSGMRIPAGSVAVMQVHYNLAGGNAPDRTKLELKFAPVGTEASLQEITTLRLIQPSVSIPPASTGHVETKALTAKTWSLNRFYADGDAYIAGVAGHMHTHGASFTITMTRNGVTSTLLELPRWDFHWQGSYTLQTPVRVLPTDQLTVTCVYDNTGASTIHWGEGTADEMCLGYVQVVDQPLP
jgi:Copper type II ascorbate-dependent monooxygenase, C-terminal domain